MNRIDKLFQSKKTRILSIYFTAGYPSPGSVGEIITAAEKYGVDMMEIGIPYSDPLADGPVIQETGKTAIANGMTIQNLFSQLEGIREKTSIPLLLMSYINPVMQFGFKRFCKEAADKGIDGLIIPDLPLVEYNENYRDTVVDNDLKNIFLITPDTSDERIRVIDQACTGFLYMVSSASTTGKTKNFGQEQTGYFQRISLMKLKNPVMAGFGIHNRETLEQVYACCNGGIIGTAFMRELQKGKSVGETFINFFNSLR